MNDSACYALKVGQTPILLSRSGQPFDVHPGDTRYIANSFSFNQFTNGDGIGQAINNLDQVAGRFLFTDSSQVLIRSQINPPAAPWRKPR